MTLADLKIRSKKVNDVLLARRIEEILSTLTDNEKTLLFAGVIPGPEAATVRAELTQARTDRENLDAAIDAAATESDIDSEWTTRLADPNYSKAKDGFEYLAP